MNKDSTDFMLTEYDRISSAYFGLRDAINEWFKAFLTLVGLPLTVLAAAQRISGNNLTVSLTDLPDTVSGLLIVVSILGFFVALSIISMRMEMILYARTINGVRRYFANEDCKLVDFLILPTSDSTPPFYESWRAMLWQVLLIGILDGIIMFVAIHSITSIGLAWSIVIGVGFFTAHWAVYRFTALKNESEWKTHFVSDLNSAQS